MINIGAKPRQNYPLAKDCLAIIAVDKLIFRYHSAWWMILCKKAAELKLDNFKIDKQSIKISLRYLAYSKN